MSKTRREQDPLLNVCKECGQKLPDPMVKIPKALERLRKEFGFGEKCESK